MAPDKDLMAGYTDSLSHPNYQEPTWVKQQLESKNQSYKKEIDQVLESWRGRRYDEDLLKKYQIEFIRKPNALNAVRQSAAIYGFSGLAEGYAPTYWSIGYKNYFLGREEYWALVKSWPKSASPYLYRLRAIHYALIGGNTELRNPAFKHYLAFDSSDDLIRRMEINSRIVLKGSYGPKQTEQELLLDYKTARAMYDKKPGTHSLSCAYGLASLLNNKFPKAKYREDCIELGEKLVAEYSKNSIDQRLVPGLKKFLNELKKKK